MTPLHSCGTFQERQRCKTAGKKKSFQPSSDMDEEGGRGRRLLGAAFSISQMVQLLLLPRCFAPHVYTRGGHSRKAEDLRSLSTLHGFFFPISKEEFGHPFPSLQLPIQAQPHSHTERSPSFLLFPPPFTLGLGLAYFKLNRALKLG